VLRKPGRVTSDAKKGALNRRYMGAKRPAKWTLMLNGLTDLSGQIQLHMSSRPHLALTTNRIAPAGNESRQFLSQASPGIISGKNGSLGDIRRGCCSDLGMIVDHHDSAAGRRGSQLSHPPINSGYPAPSVLGNAKSGPWQAAGGKGRATSIGP
jgi:hypothetical protein